MLESFRDIKLSCIAQTSSNARYSTWYVCTMLLVMMVFSSNTLAQLPQMSIILRIVVKDSLHTRIYQSEYDNEPRAAHEIG